MHETVFISKQISAWCGIRKVLLIKKPGCDVVLYSSKHGEITFPHEFLFEFTQYNIKEILSKTVVKGRGFGKKYTKEG